MHRKLLVHGLLAAVVALGAAGLALAQEKAADPTAGADYLGVKSCKMCHKKQYDAWSATKHAKALGALQAADEKTVAEVATKLKLEVKKATDDACVKCHVTGLGAKTGFVASDTTKVAVLGAVTCEACHGPGSKHKAATKDQKKATMNAAVTKEACLRCHTPEMSPKFDFDAMKTKVHLVAAAVGAK